MPKEPKSLLQQSQRHSAADPLILVYPPTVPILPGQCQWLCPWIHSLSTWGRRAWGNGGKYVGGIGEIVVGKVGDVFLRMGAISR